MPSSALSLLVGLVLWAGAIGTGVLGAELPPLPPQNSIQFDSESR